MTTITYQFDSISWINRSFLFSTLSQIIVPRLANTYCDKGTEIENYRSWHGLLSLYLDKDFIILRKVYVYFAPG
jgi:hypothetical protein